MSPLYVKYTFYPYPQSFVQFLYSGIFHLQTVRDHRVLNRVANIITTWDEITTLGLELSCNPNDVARLRSENRSIKEAAYEILRSFYERNINSDKSIEATLKETLTELGKGALVLNLGLEELN